MEENGIDFLKECEDNCFMKLSALPIAYFLIMLAGCNQLNSKQYKLTQICGCVERNEKDFNNRATEEMLGSYFNATMAETTAFGCAQEIMESENLSYTEMIALYQDFIKSDCGKRYNVDAASVDKMEQDAIKERDRIINEYNSGQNTNGDEKDTEESSMEPQIDTFYTPDNSLDSIAHSSTQPMSDDEAQKMFEKYVNPTIEKMGEKPIKGEVVSEYPFRPKEKRIEYVEAEADKWKNKDPEQGYLEWLEAELKKGTYSKEVLEPLIEEQKKKVKTRNDKP